MREVALQLPCSRGSVPRARALLHAVLGAWRVGQEVLESAELVLSELVTNAMRVSVPCARYIGVRMVRPESDGVLRLEVIGMGPGRPEIRVPEEDETRGRGLMLVDVLAHRWGAEVRECGIGKTVWAELKAPDIVAPPEGKEIEAVTVRPGQCVRVWGEWRAVQSVRAEPYAAGGLAVVLGLDEGPALRLHAAEPVTVRDGQSQ
ncbi:ATP-binding protein [Streptomyces sp. NPDC050095]|uniref:ATP-binding protein n=1 Tax=unclassified Streptomyces TaxID=2593676 RepID=UPI00341A1463